MLQKILALQFYFKKSWNSLYAILMTVYDILFSFKVLVSLETRARKNKKAKMLQKERLTVFNIYFLISAKIYLAAIKAAFGRVKRKWCESACTHLIKALKWLIIIVAITIIAVLSGLIAVLFRRWC
jgi:hypothetical protein